MCIEFGIVVWNCLLIGIGWFDGFEKCLDCGC